MERPIPLSKRKAKKRPIKRTEKKMETITPLSEIKEEVSPTPTPRQEERKLARKERIPVGNSRLKLSARNIPPGKVGRWFVDWGGRIEEATAGYYDFLSSKGVVIGDPGTEGNEDIGTRVSKITGVNPDGTPQRSYLMVIDKETYDADQVEKAKKLDEVDSEIRRGSFKAKPNDNRYVPKEGITYKP